MVYPVDPCSGSEPAAGATAAPAEPGQPPDIVRSRPLSTSPHLEAVHAGPVDSLDDGRERHPSAGLARHLDVYLAAVAEALQVCGVIAGPPQRTGSAAHLIGSIVIDCSAVCSPEGETGPAQPHARCSGSFDCRHPTPVIVVWDEDLGWAVGLHHGSGNSSRRYLHADLLPPPTEVAEFVVDLALGEPPVDEDLMPTARPGPPLLRLLR